MHVVRSFISSIIVLLAFSSVVLSQNEKRQLTLEWIFGPEGRTVSSLPATAWLDDGTLVILDNRRPPAEPALARARGDRTARGRAAPARFIR